MVSYGRDVWLGSISAWAILLGSSSSPLEYWQAALCILTAEVPHCKSRRNLLEQHQHLPQKSHKTSDSRSRATGRNATKVA